MESFLRKTLLLDFYGDLLTETQKSIYEMHFLYDLSLSEIAEKRGVSPQGIRDSLICAEKKLEDYDVKLNLIDSHFAQKEKVTAICDSLECLIKPYVSEADFRKAASLLQELKEDGYGF